MLLVAGLSAGLGYTFELRPYGRVISTEGSLARMTIGFLINELLHSKNQFDDKDGWYTCFSVTR